MASFLHLRTGLTCCLCNDRAVFLDCTADRYFCLPSDLNEAFIRQFVDGELFDDDVHHRLRSLRFDPDDKAERPYPSREDIPNATEELPPSPTALSPMRAAIAQWEMRFRLQSSMLEHVVTRERSRRPWRTRRREPVPLSSLATAFARAALWLGESDQCLARALAFRKLAMRLGHHPIVVLGVKLDPFGAHAWAQTGTRLDNDVLERVRLFQPILSI